MRKCPTKKIVLITALSILSLLLIFGSLVYFNVIPLLPEQSATEINHLDRYVSETEEDSLAEEIESTEDSETSESVDENKSGELETDETRQVLNTESDLTDAEKSELEDKYGIEFIEDGENGVYVIEVDENSDVDGLQDEEDITGVEVDIPVKMFADTVDWGINRIGANSVWESTTGNGIKVAIIDTGIQTDHPDLAGNIVSGYDFVNNDSSAYDDNGHGTHVAGIVAATFNQAGTVGAGYNASLMPIKVLNSDGYGYLSDVAEGIYYAADNGARVINLSLGASTDSITLRNAVNYATNKGVLVVAAAGNDYGAPCSYPAAYSSAVCVVATDSNNKLASFSNIGGELAAPGVSNYSTFAGSTYRYLSGTSMATPHISGSAALLMSLCTTCTTSEIRSTLRDTAVDLGNTGTDIIFGYGLVDLASAVHSLTEEEEEVPTEEPVEEDPTEEVPDDTDTPEDTNKPEKIVRQYISITSPETTKNKRYVHMVEEDIVLEFELDPIVDSSNLSKIEIYIDNSLVYTTTEQSDTYEIELEVLDHSQHSIKAIAYFSDGPKSQDSIVIDMTYLQTDASSNRGRGRSVLGASTSIFDQIFSIFNF